jgi:DNA-binding PadR family transcriptional regulator
MRSKEDDDFHVLTLLHVLSEHERARGLKKQGLNKYEIEQELKKAKDYHPTYRAVRETIQRLEDEGAIGAVRTERGRAPNTKTKFYALTDLGAQKLAALKGHSDFYINAERARRIVEKEEEPNWTPDATRACLEMGIAQDWLISRLRDPVLKALAQTKKSRDVERVARTVSRILLPDLATFIRVCYRHRDATRLDGIPVSNFALGPGEVEVDETCAAWLEKFAPGQFDHYVGRLPPNDVALICVLSKSEAQARRELAREDERLGRLLGKYVETRPDVRREAASGRSPNSGSE